MRLHQFGPNSTKVGETLADWSKMLLLQGRDVEAASMQARVKRIQNLHREPSALWPALASVAFFLISIFISNIFIGRRGILTELVVGKIKLSVDAACAEPLSKPSALPPSTVKIYRADSLAV